MKRWHKYRYKNLTILALSLIVAILLFKNSYFRSILLSLGSWGYLGSFIAGIMFVSTFTVSFGTVILLILANNHLSPIEIGIFAGVGAVVGDILIFQAIRNHDFIDELRHVFEFLGGDKITHLLNTKYFSWSLPVIGAIIIASPLPDEVGVSMMGISKMKTYQFVLLSFILNSIGIFLVVTAGTLL